ncbi:DUF397 domain-containing protein [Streptomyces sp. NPDC047706]|uniref:DUF397 domain-containing protein n=1 Tax=Streptomyces sp. NPDC047706 TaxID=3365486 RepID=UPI00371A12F3
MSDRLTWFKSSYSDSEGSNCLEAALDTEPRTIHLRDSKLGARSPQLAVAGDAWAAFVAYARTGA